MDISKLLMQHYITIPNRLENLFMLEDMYELNCNASSTLPNSNEEKAERLRTTIGQMKNIDYISWVEFTIYPDRYSSSKLRSILTDLKSLLTEVFIEFDNRYGLSWLYLEHNHGIAASSHKGRYTIESDDDDSDIIDGNSGVREPTSTFILMFNDCDNIREAMMFIRENDLELLSHFDIKYQLAQED